MEYVDESYRTELGRPFRGASYVYAYIGLINGDAQQNAKITSSFSGSEASLYNSGTTGSGVTSTENDGHITFTFTDLYELNIAGLTLTFKTVPSSITVTNGSKTKTYEVNENPFSFDDGYTDCHTITITPNSGKLSLTSILFGIGLQFTNKQIVSTSRNNKISHISNELPHKTFELKVNNRAKMFNADNPYGYANYLQEKQEIKFNYGRELADGTMYTIKGGKVLLKSWSSDDYEAKFSCVGYLDFLDTMYERGKYYPDGISAYDLAIDVLQDAGISNYRLDESLKGIIIHNPIPSCEHRDALKMIANASMCTLYEDRDGNICIMSGSLSSTGVGEVTFTGATEYSQPSSIFSIDTAYNYADCEANYVYADGTLRFLPEAFSDDFYYSRFESESALPVGFVSSSVANSSGVFSTNPTITIKFQSEYKLKGMYLTFGVVVPTQFTVYCYLDSALVNSYTTTNPSSTVVSLSINEIVDKIVIGGITASPNQRFHLNHIEIEGGTEYLLTYHELRETPVATSLERVKNINVHINTYSKSTTEDGSALNQKVNVNYYTNSDGGVTANISTSESNYGGSISSVNAVKGLNHVTFEKPYFNYKVSAGTIVDSGVYFVDIKSDKAQTIDIYAESYNSTENTYTLKVHEKGTDKESNNPLISDINMAMRQADWLREYYDDDLEYNLTYRGDPVLDADDLIYLENDFVENNEIRIVEETINTSVGIDFSCRLNARRNSYQTDATLQRAVVGRVRLGERIY